MPPRPTVTVASIVDLPSVIQSLAGSRRSGVLLVRHGSEERRFHFASGQVVAVGGGSRGLFASALGWTRAVTPAAIAAVVATLGSDPDPEQLAAQLRARGELQAEDLVEALALVCEEEIATAVAWPAPDFDLVSDAGSDSWTTFQRTCGLSLNPSAVLLEALRRQDERSSCGDLIPDAWDVLHREEGVALPDGADEDAGLILAACAPSALFKDLLVHPLMPSHRSVRAVVFLRRAGVLRVVTAAELAQLGEQAREQGRVADAYGILSRAVALGHDGARIRELLANLAEQQGDKAAAAVHCLEAVPHLQTPQAMVQALKHALRLGSDPEGPLTQLVALNLTLGDDRATLEALLTLVRLYETRGDRQRAIEALGEAQSLGADTVVTARMMARLAAASGDVAQAALQLEQAARQAGEQGRRDEAIEAWQALAELRPERLEPARACAELQAAAGRNAEAVKTLGAALARAKSAPEEVQLAAWELLSRLDPGDTAAHDWLAKTYAKRRDRDGATRQLRLVADAQEKEGDDQSLVETLERIVVLGGEDVALLHRLGDAHDRLGRQTAAIDAWCRAADLATEAGKLESARAVVSGALASNPGAAALRARSADLILREGDLVGGLKELRRAVDLATGAGDAASAKDLLTRLCGLRPDDLLARIQLCELLREGKDPDEVAAVEDVVRLAVRRADFGLAVEHARRRLQVVPPADAERAHRELIELLRRAGDSAGERTAARELLDQLLEAGQFDRAVALLSRQFAAHPRDPDLALQLAEAQGALGDERMAARCYRHAVQLLQAEGRIDEARAALDQLEQVSEDDLLIRAARRRLDAGEAVEWDQIRNVLEHDQRKGLVDKLGSEMIAR